MNRHGRPRVHRRLESGPTRLAKTHELSSTQLRLRIGQPDVASARVLLLLRET